MIEVPNWGWMLGTGVYVDDIDDALSEIDSRVSRNIEDTMLWIAGIAFLATVVIFLGLLRNIRERTVLDERLSEANSNLAALTQRLIDEREKERKRVEYLHDGIQSILTVIKMNVETPVKFGQATPTTFIIKHPMRTGLQRDLVSQGTIPAYFINKAVFSFNNKTVMDVDFGVGTAEDPYLRFDFLPGAPGTLEVKATDNEGKAFEHSIEVKS